MSMIDLNDEQEQRERNYGPVPCGSKVLVRLEVQKPKYASRDDEMVAMTKSGLLQLQCKIEVCAGSYEGCWWYENITLPSRIQTIRLDENLQTACRIGGSMLRAIIESVRSIDPKASDQKPRAHARSIPGWTLTALNSPCVWASTSAPMKERTAKRTGIIVWEASSPARPRNTPTSWLGVRLLPMALYPVKNPIKTGDNRPMDKMASRSGSPCRMTVHRRLMMILCRSNIPSCHLSPRPPGERREFVIPYFFFTEFMSASISLAFLSLDSRCISSISRIALSKSS